MWEGRKGEGKREERKGRRKEVGRGGRERKEGRVRKEGRKKEGSKLVTVGEEAKAGWGVCSMVGTVPASVRGDGVILFVCLFSIKIVYPV